jgi:hypothetical protein
VRNHSSRLAYIDKVIFILQPSNIFLSVYESNIFTFIINFIRNPLLYLKYRRHISFKPMKYNDYVEVMKQSEFTIDYAHYTQTGITMRCFEAINMKTKIITNNEYISRSSYFNDSNCIVFPENGCPDTLINAYNECKAKPYNTRSRTINDFIGELVKY